MKWIAIVALVVMLSGCRPMSRDEVIAATKQCEEAGMRAAVMVNELDMILDVQCRPKPEPRNDD